MEPLKVVGHSLPLKDAAEKAAGTGIYTVDMTLPGMLHGKILRSPHAHARILKVDASKALALRGVRAVVTPDDVPRNKFTTAQGRFMVDAARSHLSEHAVHHFHNLVLNALDT